MVLEFSLILKSKGYIGLYSTSIQFEKFIKHPITGLINKLSEVF